MQFNNMGEVPLYLKILKPSVLVFEKTDSKVLSCFARIFDFLGLMLPKKKNDNIEVREVTKDNLELFDQLWNNLKNKYRVIGMRNKLYMKWRYIDIPLRKYKIYCAFEKGIPRGYIVGRVAEVAGMHCGMIVDFLFESGRDDIGYCLLKELRKVFCKQNVGLLGSLMQKRTEEARCLEKIGFFKCPKFLEPQPFPIIYRQFLELQKGKEVCMNDFSNWFFTMGDYDVI